MALPPVTVAKFEEVGRLVQQLVDENESLFIERGQRYREQHRETSSRRLSPEEAVQVAVAAEDERTVEDRAAAFQSAELRAYDEPDVREVMAAAGVATAPAFVKATRRAVALIEMDLDTFEKAYEAGVLDEAVDSAAKALMKVELGAARERAEKALAHFAEAAGADTGKGLGLLVRALWQALSQAMDHLTSQSPRRGSSSLFASPETSDGAGETSFTEHDGSTPSPTLANSTA